MMSRIRPYLAVIVDSFREAFATRVLWVILLLIGLLLAAVAPFTYREAVAVNVRYEDFSDSRGMLLHVREQAEQSDSPPGYLWSRLSEGLQKDMAGLSVDSERRERNEAFGRFRNEVNKLLRERDFYRDDVWKDARLNREGRDLLKQGVANLSETDLARFNRLALDAAFARFLEPAASSAVQFEYAGYDLGDELPISDDQVREVGELILAGAVSWLVGFFGILAALVVTSSVVPRMLEAGSIDLLLSKPVSRSGLFLSRFAGGCAFILLVTSVLVCGLWVIVGTRLGIWNSGLLWTIPVFVFVFAVYFSVSALAGVLWRNAIVSIVVSLVFWVVCFGVGLTKGIVDDVFLSARRLNAVLPLNDSLLVVSRDGNGLEWDPQSSSWQTLFENRRRGPGGGYPFVGPRYDAANDRLVAIRTSNGGPPWMRGAPKLAIATRDADWKFSTPLNVPAGSKEILVLSDGDVLTAGSGGLFHLNKSSEPRGLLDMLSMAVPLIPNDSDPEVGRFDSVGDESLQWRSPIAAAVENPSVTEAPAKVSDEDDAGTAEDEPASQQSRAVMRIAVVSGESLAVLRRDRDGRFSVEQEAVRDSESAAVLAFASGRIVAAEEGGQVRVLNAANLSEVTAGTPFGKNDPKSIAVSPDGRHVAIVFHHRRMCVVDVSSGAITKPALASQGDVSAVAYGPDGTLLVAHGFGYVTEYSSGTDLEVKARYETPPDLLQSVYEWAIDPLHTVFPKPGEMDNLVAWLMTREQTIQTGEGDALSANRTVIDIWEPLWSNLAFLSVVLMITCVLISRRDF